MHDHAVSYAEAGADSGGPVVVLVHGIASRAAQWEAVMELAATVPGTRLEVFEAAGHFPHLTEPARLAEVLGGWIARTPPVSLDGGTLTARMRQLAIS